MHFITSLVRQLDILIPSYARTPVILCIVVNFLAFYGTRLVNTKKKHYDFSTAPDRSIPFFPPAVIIYVLAFAQWIIGYIMLCRAGEEICYTFATADLIAKFICLVCFLVIPTRMERPTITVKGPVTWLASFIFKADAPDNLFPSIHCLESWLCFRASLELPHAHAAYRWCMFLMAIAVFASVLLLKQHLFVDVIAGVAVVEIGLLIARQVNFHLLFRWVDQACRVISAGI